MKTAPPLYPFQPLPEELRPQIQNLLRRSALHFLCAADMRRRRDTSSWRYAWHVSRGAYVQSWAEGWLFWTKRVRVDLDQEVYDLINSYPKAPKE